MRSMWTEWIDAKQQNANSRIREAKVSKIKFSKYSDGLCLSEFGLVLAIVELLHMDIGFM